MRCASIPNSIIFIVDVAGEEKKDVLTIFTQTLNPN
jgi:hypothetical protein